VQQSEERYRRMVDEAPDAIFAIAPNRIITALNPAFESMTGHARAEWIGRDFAPLIAPPDMATADEIFRQVMNGRRPSLFELRLCRKSGEILHVEFMVVPQHQGGRVVGVTGIGRNVTARRLAEAAWRESEARFRELAETINEVFWITDPGKDQMLYISPSYEKIWGRTCQSLYDSPRAWFDAIHPEDRPAVFHAALNKQAELGAYDMKYRIVRPDGTERWIRDRAFPVHHADATLKHIVGVAEDITEARQLEERLRQSQKMEAIGTLAGGIAHDFNNMLAAIMLHLDLLKIDATVSPSMQGSLGELSQAARRAARLTRQLLLFSRREAAQFQPVDLNAVVHNLLKMLDRLVGENFALMHTGDPQPLWIYADPSLIELVVINLVVNARDAAARPEPAAAERFVRLRVIDSGCGMSADTKARIFEPFFTTKEAGKGTGLGLSTVFGIVQQHSGWLDVESAEGKGSSFSVYLPAHSSPAQPDPPGVAGATKVAKGRETILVVEDNDAIRHAATNLLRQRGYRVMEAADGRAAQQMLDEQPDRFDLVLTDDVMPGGIMGHELAATLRAGVRRPKLILMSGQTAPNRGPAEPPAINAYLAKPFDADRLLRVVRATLDGVALQP
jgi:PAS domain S-box-containing protein